MSSTKKLDGVSSSDNLPHSAQLHVYCGKDSISTAAAESMNIPIANSLKAIPPHRRSMRLESCLLSRLNELPTGVLIRDIDVLFNPAYEVDVLALLCSAYRKHRFNLVWPGRLEGNYLLYAEEGCPDYKAFDINRYDIACIY